MTKIKAEWVAGLSVGFMFGGRSVGSWMAWPASTQNTHTCVSL